MTVTVTRPTVVQVKTRFPEFADVDDAQVEFAIEEAMLAVGSNWSSGYNIAALYLTAHYIASAVAASNSSSGASGEIASESFGRISISYAQSTSASATDLTTSSYGERYLELRAKNFAGPKVVI